MNDSEAEAAMSARSRKHVVGWLQKTELRSAGYAIYWVCEDVNGVCMYRRQDLEVEVRPRR